MEFRVLSKNTWVPGNGKNTVYLKVDNWNDYSFVTSFYLSLHDGDGRLHNIGDVKIGFKGQTTEISTYNKLENRFIDLGEEFFSLGQGIEFYQKMAALPAPLGKQILSALRDIVVKSDVIESIKNEEVFGTSLLRGVSLSVVKGQYARILNGLAELTDFKFKFLDLKS